MFRLLYFMQEDKVNQKNKFKIERNDTGKKLIVGDFRELLKELEIIVYSRESEASQLSWHPTDFPLKPKCHKKMLKLL